MQRRSDSLLFVNKCNIKKKGKFYSTNGLVQLIKVPVDIKCVKSKKKKKKNQLLFHKSFMVNPKTVITDLLIY